VASEPPRQIAPRCARSQHPEDAIEGPRCLLHPGAFPPGF
jgi:hypothetical protein